MRAARSLRRHKTRWPMPAPDERFAHEAVAQRSGQPVSGVGGFSAVGDGCVLSGGVTVVGAVSGPHGGDLVTVKLGEVVGHHH